ncbi:MAG: N-6 DNA methylase, partial [Anaerolineae bacterium]|nr:N-6 DNA methylase [Anaerolineae bacterium]
SLSYVRMFVEDQAYISAIVSLPPETFFSSGASVKASLLFLRKFTNSEQSLYNSIKADVEEKVKEKYKDEIKQMENDFLNQIAVAKDQGDMTMKKQLQRDLKSYLKNMEETKFQEARLLLKRNFNYPVFLYEAERVGITSTGGPDENELYPNDNAPKDIPTCLDLYRQFKNNDRVSD